MIEAMSRTDRAYHEGYDSYPAMTKFIGSDGTGHRGSIIRTLDDGQRALLYGLTGEYFGQLVTVREFAEGEWPRVDAVQLGQSAL